ncbi:MAG: serine hydrolase domain-containing protein [Actinomycetota bacterium]
MNGDDSSTAGGQVAPEPSGRRQARRWIKVCIAAVVVLASLVGIVYLRAFLTLDSSTFSRALVWVDADVDDFRRFPARRIHAPPDPYLYEKGPGYPSGLPDDVVLPDGNDDLEPFLRSTDTTAFIVVERDVLLYERYFNGYEHDSTQTSFSVAKSFASALVGIAIDDGDIALDDPITDYLPELKDRDERFERISIRHLISMSSGLRYEEQGTPWSDDTETYYAPDLRKLALTDTEVIGPPGEDWHYNNFNPLLLGMILERTTSQDVAGFMEARLWQPLGAEADASWSLDSEAGGFEKMESGINARAIDFAKLGSLYLHEGEWNGTRILPASWVRESSGLSNEGDDRLQVTDGLAPAYGYWWWTYRDDELGDYFAARGNKGQFIVVIPERDVVVVRHGRDFGDVEDWVGAIADIARSL